MEVGFDGIKWTKLVQNWLLYRDFGVTYYEELSRSAEENKLLERSYTLQKVPVLAAFLV
jgi:hypothetical protein